MRPLLTLGELVRIRRWQLRHRHSHPLEVRLWDTVLTLGLVGTVGVLPGWVLGGWPGVGLAVLLALVPEAYARGRRHAHRRGRLRCDWIGPAG